MAVKGLFYTKDHEWISIEGDLATMGITDYAQEQLGELVFVELPAIGKQVSAHDEIAIVESSKAANDVYSPVTGKVIEVNQELESNPELINEDCYKKGWIVKLQLSDPISGEDLMNSDQYKEYVAGL
ncbi:MAG: glycine cleavage system protein GcvH [Planctomycetota bacterium]|jgi:glycine cleavage system H protein